MSDPTNRVSRCESCGVQYEAPKDEVVSSRALCQKCAAERRAKLKAAKAATSSLAGSSAGASASAAPAARPATKAPQPAVAPAATATRSSRAATKEGPSRSTHSHYTTTENFHHDPDYSPKKHREDERKRIAKLAWMVTGGMGLIVGIVLLVVMSKRDARTNEIAAHEKQLDDFRDWVIKVDLTNEEALKAAKERINTKESRSLWRNSRIENDVLTSQTKINASLGSIIRTRGIREQLDGIEGQLASPAGDLKKQYDAVRDGSLTQEAAEAGDELKVRHDRLKKQVYQRYIESLRAAATAAASSTTGEGLAPFGTLEDVLRTVRDDATIANDLETQALYKPMWNQVYKEINEISPRLFDEAYRNRVPWTDLLADTAGWTVVTSSSFSHKFAGNLTLTNAPEGAIGGLSYHAGDHWRDYVIDLEFKLDSGGFTFYTRIGDKMDTKEVPGFTVGATKTPNVLLEYGKVYSMQVSTIGTMLVVVLDGVAVYPDDIQGSKCRKGEPGIAVQTGTNMTITRLKVRHLR